ncbi:MAG: TMAO reductase system periplasmic protein TorT [Ancylobacter novellus]|uniref:TMAO reductase system periplasmic protein TorT n=1 Tax=Ancylobacter novellus TaxID=921 RepID=A0A2W5KKA3_ANCNO|nr:MAG: TMAO reductase system periplasmic protein TorT [Ancylobacter novellus]
MACKSFERAAAVAVLTLFAGGASAADWFPLKMNAWDPPFDFSNKPKEIEYSPLPKASERHKICVSFPHLKDAYWLGVDYGVIEEAKRQGVQVQLLEAGGYTELNKQISQIEDCISGGAKAIIIGAISYDGLNNVVADLKKKNIPVVDVINGMSSPDVGAKSLVSFADMGAAAGKYLAEHHPAGSKAVKVAWLPGPAGAGWVESGNKGFLEAVKGSSVDIVDVKYGDTGKEVQAKLVEDVLQAHPDLDYIAGTAVTAEAATPILRARGLSEQVKLVAYYYTPGVDQYIRRGSVLAAPTDSPVIQGRVALDEAVRLIEGNITYKHVGPVIQVVTKDNVSKIDMSTTLAPPNFKATFATN